MDSVTLWTGATSLPLNVLSVKGISRPAGVTHWPGITEESMGYDKIDRVSTFGRLITIETGAIADMDTRSAVVMWLLSHGVRDWKVEYGAETVTVVPDLGACTSQRYGDIRHAIGYTLVLREKAMRGTATWS